MSCHAYQFYFEATKEFKPHRFVTSLPLEKYNGKYFYTPTIDDFFAMDSIFVLPQWFTQVLTIVRRRIEYLDHEIMKHYTGYYDYITCYYMLKAGRCALFKDVMGVYRKHHRGVYSGRNDEKWTNNSLADYNALYRIEKEKRALPLIAYYFRDAVINCIHQNRKKQLASLLLSQSRIVSLSFTMRSIGTILKSYIASKC